MHITKFLKLLTMYPISEAVSKYDLFPSTSAPNRNLSHDLLIKFCLLLFAVLSSQQHAKIMLAVPFLVCSGYQQQRLLACGYHFNITLKPLLDPVAKRMCGSSGSPMETTQGITWAVGTTAVLIPPRNLLTFHDAQGEGEKTRLPRKGL